MSTETKDQRDLQTVLGELKEFQEKYQGQKVPEAEAEKWDALVKEAEELQASLDREEFVEKFEERANEVPKRRVPGGATGQEGERREGTEKQGVVGYLPLGKAVALMGRIEEWKQAGMPKEHFQLFETNESVIGRPRKRSVFVGLKREQMEQLQQKSGATLGEDVIQPTRLPDIERVEDAEHQQLRLRDVLDIGSTNSDAVRYVRMNSVTRAADHVAHGGLKPEAAIELETVTEPVKTRAVTIPVHEQQLADWGQLRTLIDGELIYDLDLHVEEQVLYGDGAGEDFNGIVPQASAAREETDDTLIDRVRRAITDVRKSQGQPNAVVMDPLDWEAIVLEKGDDSHYVWVVVTEGDTMRLWALPVVESQSMETDGGDTRNILVGDFNRGATLWDRQQNTIATGFVNDQFIRNMRTIRAEARAAFGVKRPHFFRTITTEEPA